MGSKYEDVKCTNCGKEIKRTCNVKKCNHFCSSKCRMEYYENIKINDWRNDPEKYNKVMNIKIIKRYILNKQDYKCAICGMKNVWNNKPITFIIDHINGDASNNEENNLRCICPNCDSQLDTYKSKNKNSARSNREYYVVKTKDKDKTNDEND